MRLLLAALALFALLVWAKLARSEIICTLLTDPVTGAVLLEEGDCATPVTPASTFKIPLAAMGYDAGFLTDAHHPVLSFQPGDPDWGGENWLRDTDPMSWMLYSVVWYSQRITRALGADRLTAYARAFGYGNADFSGDPGQDNGLERAWIASSLLVSPRDQARFLQALVTDSLPVSQAAMTQTRALVEGRRIEDWQMQGKTGGAYPRRADRSFDYARGWGWYVGWAERAGRQIVFVRLIQGREPSQTSPGLLARDAFLADWPALARRIATP
jgi:beta-lactamase class D